MGCERKEKGATKTIMNKDDLPKSLLLRLVIQDIRYRKRVQLFYAKWYGLFFLLGWIAGYSHAMIMITDDFFWYPGKNYEE